MCGGGAKGPAPTANYTDPVTGKTFWTSDLLNQAINEREQTEQTKSLQTQQEAEAKKQQERDTFGTGLNTAFTSARDNTMRYFQDRGSDPNKYVDRIDSELGRLKGTVPDLAPNPQGFFGPDVSASIYNDILGTKRENARDAFTPYGSSFLEQTLGSGLASQAANDIVQDQFTTVGQGVETARKRGQLDPTGYEAALRAMETKRGQAVSEVGGIANNALTTQRNALSDYINSLKGEVGNMDLEHYDNWSVDPYAQRIQAKAGEIGNNFAGNVRSAVGDAQFINLQDLINLGGTAQGPLPVAAAPGGGAEASLADQILSKQRRGLGNTGAF
jgi:hypothetical protein